MDDYRIRELYDIANEQAEEILLGWWRELGSWDGLLEDGELTMEELEWIWANVKVGVTIG